MTYLEPRMNKISRRLAVRANVEREMYSAQTLLEDARKVTADDARRLALLCEAIGDLTSALVRGQGVSQELLLVQAMAQLWSENIEAERAR